MREEIPPEFGIFLLQGRDMANWNERVNISKKVRKQLVTKMLSSEELHDGL